jgi:hypothetical protein
MAGNNQLVLPIKYIRIDWCSQYGYRVIRNLSSGRSVSNDTALCYVTTVLGQTPALRDVAYVCARNQSLFTFQRNHPITCSMWWPVVVLTTSSGRGVDRGWWSPPPLTYDLSYVIAFSRGDALTNSRKFVHETLHRIQMC